MIYITKRQNNPISKASMWMWTVWNPRHFKASYLTNFMQPRKVHEMGGDVEVWEFFSTQNIDIVDDFWFFDIVDPGSFSFWLEFSRNIKYPCQFFVGRVLFQRKKRLMDERNLFGWGTKEVGIWCKVAAAWFDIMIYSGSGSNIQQGYILKLHPESKCAWKCVHRLCRVRRCCKYRIL